VSARALLVTPTVREGYLPVPGGRIWYRRVGGGAGRPLVIVHGGPGSPHDYLESMAALAEGREVVFYDQLGCGRSDRPEDPGLWTVQRFVLELRTLIVELGLERPHLLGHSWGTIPAAEYALRFCHDLASLALISPCLNLNRVVADMELLRGKLPRGLQSVLRTHEARGTTDSAPYRLAAREFYRHHVCRMEVWPRCLAAGFDGWSLGAYRTMWGPSEFFITGTLRTYDVTPRLPELRLSVLFACGRHDEMTPETTSTYQALVPGSQLLIFETSSHLPHLEQESEFLAVTSQFLSLAETGRPTECDLAGFRASLPGGVTSTTLPHREEKESA
jgi:proline iminopeptidase